jgi:hypothetical protein
VLLTFEKPFHAFPADDPDVLAMRVPVQRIQPGEDFTSLELIAQPASLKAFVLATLSDPAIAGSAAISTCRFAVELQHRLQHATAPLVVVERFEDLWFHLGQAFNQLVEFGRSHRAEQFTRQCGQSSIADDAIAAEETAVGDL